ncbi:trifunctional serine/threonine-protein kinase/ATP-binding protein/sensor histidine kinase [Aerosakkonema funiforme]|uniref:trifunctional serine/threonine-protein kinase/ATP-binding protein/sensor histidine kinase n=1 Tax=Aerosakkonema funiforme TaxID=1246630 RepID=UPI0035B86CC6
MNLTGYQLNTELYNGSRTIVYRGEREFDSLPVAIKFLKNPYPNFSELVQFRNQYTLAKNLNSPRIIKTYSLETYQNGYALVMEDFGGVSLSHYFQSRQKLPAQLLAEFLSIALVLCEALDLLYRERVIHKDIKPSNILINPQTKEVKLIDFSIASLLPRETQTLVNPHVLEGTLAYISPEQTGRMNRGIDYRTDFYSLGVTFYELLTGELPFSSNDAMELVHSHLAKTTPLVNEINTDIPSVISKIVSKLMAKNAEDRYQSALGLKFDLDKCLTQLRETGEIEDFEIAQQDRCDRFIIPDKLYGRETEVQTLLEAFDRVSQGATELMLVAGFSGIGKTVVVNEVHKPIVRERGYFIKGKYDQFQRNIPFSAFVQSFRNLMGQLLSESDSQINSWKIKILEVVGENGQVLIDVIPELEDIIGKQPPATELSGSAAQNRFNLLFQKFVQVFASQEHPLVMFLDDLQWADSASLNLLQLLMQDTEHLLILGAYRDNEVSPVHLFILTVNEIVKTGATVNTITLSPLSEANINQLVADTLNCKSYLAEPLTKLVYQKTKGNPFFATQFLKALHDDQLISFNWEIWHWQCDIAQVKALAITDDVVEFMALQLQKLPLETQDMLKLAACIGAQFDLNTLVIVSEKSAIMTATALWKALQEGLVIPITKIYKFFTQAEREEVFQAAANPTYRFLHDRVQQAAYSLIPDTLKQPTHLKIGQQLLNATPLAARDEKLLEIVNQLNQGAESISSLVERNELAALNLAAAQKVKSSTAYRAAMEYLTKGIQLLPTDSWLQNYNLTLGLYELAAEVSCLSGNFQQMEHFVDVVFQQAQQLLDKVKVYEVKILAYVAQSQQLEAIKTALSVLELLGVTFPKEPTEIDITQSLQATQAMLADKELETLLELPEMVDPEALAALRILASMTAGVYVAFPILLPLVVFKQVQLSVQYGNAAASASAYAWYALILCGVMGEIEAGNQAGELALALLLRFKSKEFKASTSNMVYSFVKPWKYHIQTSLKPLVEGYHSGLENGALEYAGYCIWNYCYLSFFSGKELLGLQQEMMAYSQALGQLKQVAHNYVRIFYQSVLNLLGQGEYPWQIQGIIYDEQIILSQQKVDDLYELAVLYVSKLILSYLFQVWQEAKDMADSTKQYLVAAPAAFKIPVFHFYDSLTQLALWSDMQGLEQEQLQQRVAENQAKLHNWAASAPTNHLHKWLLVEAEKSRVLGQKLEAIELYDKAIAGAKENDYIQEEALANELAAKFYLDWGKENFAAGYMQQAYYCYARWGAKAKVADLEKRYPQLIAPILQQSRPVVSTHETMFTLGTVTFSSSTSSVSDTLDLTAIIKASQTISGAIELEKLLSSLLSIVIEIAGADKCVLMLLQDNHLLIQGAITPITQPIVLQSLPIADSQDIPHKLIYKVKHSQRTVVLLDATADPTLANDPYIIRQQPQSIFCSPILSQGKLLGILYLENNLTKGAFTSDRVEILNLLCTQAAISLENARLYQKSQQALQDLQQAQLQIIQSEKMSALGNLVAGVAHEMNNPLGFISASLQQAKPTFADLLEHLKLYQETLTHPTEEIQTHAEEIDLEYTLEDFPKMLDSMSIACDRLKNISTSLRTFSRADRDNKVPFNLHEGIESTLLILKHRLKANDQRPAIEVVTNYRNLPQIECFPGQLNQVFMNIIANAIDAIEESNMGKTFAQIEASPNQITIQTFLVDNQVEIRIADNGKGITEAVKVKIFDHLFTTKAVGKGTGLGLAIARQIIVEKHGGSLDCSSQPGEGTEFIISLPIKTKNA